MHGLHLPVKQLRGDLRPSHCQVQEVPRIAQN